MSTDKTIRIAIIGAGISGLVLSAALDFLDRDRRLEIKIYEGSKQLTEIGAGINFWSRTWEVFKAINLQEKLAELLVECPADPQSMHMAFTIRKSDQHDGIYIQDLKMKGGHTRFRRADLQKVLSSDMRGKLYMSHRLICYEELQDEVILHFQNGATTSCDLLIGADGIRSAVRKCFLNKQDPSRPLTSDPVFWAGEYAFRGFVKLERLEAEFPGHRACHEPVMYIGKHKYIVAYQVHANMISVGAFIAEHSKEGTVWQGQASPPCGQEEVLELFQGWEPEVLALLKCVQQPLKLGIHTIKPLKCYAKERVILVGDAAHPVTPHQGAGAGLAVEDSYILANLLSSGHCTSSTISKVSEVFNTIRCGPANEVFEKARVSGRLLGLESAGYEDITENDSSVSLKRLTALIEELGESWSWIWMDSIEDSRLRALDMLVEITQSN